jgi:hypothetical protein
MTPTNEPNKGKLAGALGSAMQQGWRRLAAQDQHEPALELLAAYAEGRLPQADEPRVAREIADSPVALEILAALLADEGNNRRLPSLEDAATTIPLARRETTAEHPRRKSQLAVWAMAASVLIAAFGLISAHNMKNQVAMLNTELVNSRRVRVAALSANEASPYLMGSTSSELTQLAIADFANTLAGGSRGGEPTEAQLAEINRAQERLVEAASHIDQSTIAGQLDYAAALASAGKNEEAAKVLDRIESSAKTSPATQSQWENLRAGLYALAAAEAPASQSRELWDKAESLFRSAAERGLNDAWLNLALALAQQDKRTDSLTAARKYLAGGNVDPQTRAMLKQALGE